MKGFELQVLADLGQVLAMMRDELQWLTWCWSGSRNAAPGGRAGSRRLGEVSCDPF